MPRLILLLIPAFAATISAPPKSPAQSIKLVTWYGHGEIPFPENKEWQLESLTVYDKGERPVATFKDEAKFLTVSLLLFNGYPDTPTAEGCRNDALNGILKKQAAIISEQKRGEISDGHGGKYATASHHSKLQGSAYNHDVFVFAGNASTCAELHVSTAVRSSDEDARLQAAIDLFRPDLAYEPNSFDHFMIANLLYKADPMQAAPYYKSALEAMPSNDPVFVMPRRVATDNLVMALGMNGDLNASRAVAQHAIEVDPDYPLNYFNLACADAEEGNAIAARQHLEQAFARKTNTIPGEHLPDPVKDDSISKLRSDKSFWAFVQTLK